VSSRSSKRYWNHCWPAKKILLLVRIFNFSIISRTIYMCIWTERHFLPRGYMKIPFFFERIWRYLLRTSGTIHMSGQGKRGGLWMFMPYSQIYNTLHFLLLCTQINIGYWIHMHVHWIEEWACMATSCYGSKNLITCILNLIMLSSVRRRATRDYSLSRV
jgi:hypothetical protein